jgi:hypothetical protein
LKCFVNSLDVVYQKKRLKTRLSEKPARLFIKKELEILDEAFVIYGQYTAA